MAITNYGELKTAIATWQRRPGVITTGSGGPAEELVCLFEASANTKIRLRLNEITTPLVAVPGVPYIDLPANYQAPVSLHETTQWRELAFVAPDMLPYYPSRGWSERWTVTDSRIQTERDADQAYAYTLRYHRKFALSDAAPTNALLDSYPNVYLYGSLLEAAAYVRDLEIIGLWQARYDRGFGELKTAEVAHKKIAKLVVDPALQSRPAPFNINRGW